MAEMVVRPLTPRDIEAWVGLRHKLWPAESTTSLRDELATLAADEFAGFGAFEGERLVGFAEVSQRPYGDGCDTAPVAWLEGIFVLAEYRRRGVGRQLVSAVEAWALAKGLVELGSDAELDNLTSRLSHALWGFAETERAVRFRKVLS
ncbi:MAG TPA: GNAT family N-acetyltransferase [Devosiaceae bacterium]|nr:GNAT family N-acetyltransferase [Devosiaceae bacterium]